MDVGSAGDAIKEVDVGSVDSCTESMSAEVPDADSPVVGDSETVDAAVEGREDSLAEDEVSADSVEADSVEADSVVTNSVEEVVLFRLPVTTSGDAVVLTVAES